MVISLGPEDIEEPPERATFRSHAAYLHAFATMIRGMPLVTRDSALSLVAAAVREAFPRPAEPRDHDAVALRGCLTRAWSTELLLASGRRMASEDEMLRLVNSWAIVQAYYVAYSATQALLVAEGGTRPESHGATQRQTIDLWVTRAGAVAPWSFAIDHAGGRNGPDRELRPVHVWSTCDPVSCWDIAAVALRSTRADAVAKALRRERDRKLKERRREWKGEEAERRDGGAKPRREPAWPATAKLTREESAGTDQRVRPYTILDYLYRLRIKANYEDAAVFITGPENEQGSKQVASDLELIAAATLLAHELRVGGLVGREAMLGLLDEWTDAHGAAASDVGVQSRRALLDRWL